MEQPAGTIRGMEADRSLHPRQLEHQCGVTGCGAAVGKAGFTEIENEAGAFRGDAETYREEFSRGAGK
jgi:hypothetical protein